MYVLFQNYNKSRIHSYRGVRDIEMTLDGFTIFKGEITRACGDIVGGSEDFGEVCNFVVSEKISALKISALILEKISALILESSKTNQKILDDGKCPRRRKKKIHFCTTNSGIK